MDTTTVPWIPTTDEVRRIVADLRPVFDECVARSRRLLGTPEGDTHDPHDTADSSHRTAA
ncbi:MAG: hypothetical protein H0W25_00400 [Acidimicrobiia bacterium]|nr:hypothetical protein [Acidimicrobiia bacterium]